MLELLARSPEGATFQDISTALSLPRSSAHGLLHTLLSRGYVELVDAAAERDRRYRLGSKVVELSAGYFQGHGHLARARALLGELAWRSGETASLVVLDGTEALYIQAEEGGQDVRLALAPGWRVPAYASAAGKVLLAGLTDDQVRQRCASPGGDEQRLMSLTPNTTVTGGSLLSDLEEVRRLGHAHDVEECLPGVHSVAAPVRGADGEVVASLSVAVPTARVDSERLVSLARLVRETARQVSQQSHDGRPAQVRRAVNPEHERGQWKAGRVRIGWSMGQMKPAFFQNIRRAAQRLAPAVGADVLWLNGRDDEHKQACDVTHLLDAGIDVLVLHPVHTLRSDALFRAAAEAGVPSICFRRPARSDAYALFAGGNTYREGEMQVEWLAARLPDGGNVVLLEGDPFNDNARNIAEGNRHALSRYPQLDLIADEVCADWSPVQAERITAELLGRARHRIDAFVCANDALAGGVIDALSTKGLAGGVLIVGGDGTASAVGRLREGTQHATVFYDPIALAEETVRAAVALARGAIDLSSLPSRSPAVNPPSRLVPALDVPLQLITRENVTDLEQFWAAASPIWDPGVSTVCALPASPVVSMLQ